MSDPPSWDEILARYDVVESLLEIGGRELRLAQVRDVNVLVDAMGPDDFGPEERLPYFATLWPAAEALAHYLAAEPSLGRVIELGAGLGLGSMAAAAHGAEVLATDWERDALAFVRRNAELNRLAVATRCCDWRDWSRSPELIGRFDLVIGADLLYEARNVNPVAHSIALLLAPSGRALIADPGRPHLGGFEAALSSLGFSVIAVSTRGSVILRAQFCGDLLEVRSERGSEL